MASLTNLSNFINTLIEEWQVPSVAVGVIENNNVIFSEAFGFRDVENKYNATTNTLFGIGSITKSFIATALGILVDKSQLDWNLPIKKYIPEFEAYDNIITNELSAIDILCHRSGFDNHAFIINMMKNNKTLIKKFKHFKPKLSFRTHYYYSNVMYVIAACLIERISNENWKKFIKENILKPLDMKNTNFSVIDSQKTNDFAFPYEKHEKDKITKTKFYNDQIMAPAGGINSTLNDMINWLKVNLNQGTYNNQKIISNKVLAEIHSPHIVIPSSGLSTEFSYDHYGLGWKIRSYKNHHMIYHAGNVDGFSSYVGFLPLDNIGVVILSNLKSNPIPNIIYMNIIETLLETSITDWNSRFLKQHKLEKEKKRKIDELREKKINNTNLSHKIDAYTGSYESPAYGKINIKCNDKKLLYIETQRETLFLKHYHYDFFELSFESTQDIVILVKFDINKEGIINKFIIMDEENEANNIIFTKLGT